MLHPVHLSVRSSSVSDFLADRTYGRAYATVMPQSVVCDVCILTKTVRPTAKVTIDSLL